MRQVFLILVAFVFASAAWATPPRVTASDDRMIAATQTHLYVLRDIEDNLGSHYSGLLDQHLIEISLDTGEATRFWPVRRMAVNRLPENDFVNPGEVQDLEGETQDITAILREVGAQPISPSFWQMDDLTLEDGSLLLKGKPVLTPFSLRALGRAQLAILRDRYPPIESEAEYVAGARIDFYDLYAEGDWECMLLPETRLVFRPADSLIIAKLTCEDADLSGIWSFHAILKDDL